MAGPDRQVHGMASAAAAAWSRRGARGPLVGFDRCRDAAQAGHDAGRYRADAGARVRDEECQGGRSEEHTSELQSHHDLVCRLLLEKKKITEKVVENLSRLE